MRPKPIDFVKNERGLYTARIPDVRPSLRFAYYELMRESNLKCMEVGVQEGRHARVIYEILQPVKLVLVDCWENKTRFTEEYYKTSYQKVIDLFKGFKEVEIIKGDSKEVLPTLQENYFDFLYIDGDHSTEVCANDIVNSLRLVKLGGVLAGHDYGYESGVKYESLGGECVDKAVHTLFDGKYVHGETGDWWVVVDSEMKQIKALKGD